MDHKAAARLIEQADRLQNENMWLRHVMARAAKIIDAELYHQREKVKDASALLYEALSHPANEAIPRHLQFVDKKSRKRSAL